MDFQHITPKERTVLKRTIILLLLLLISTTVSAQKMDIGLSDGSARITYISMIGDSTFGRTELSGGVLFNEDSNNMFDIGLQVVDIAGSESPNLELGLGPRFYYASLDRPSATGTAIAIGGNLRYRLAKVQRLVLYGAFYYAPDITSWSDADSFSELDLRIGYEMLPNADAYIGYRSIDMEVHKSGVDGNKNIDSGLFIGIRFDL